MILEFLSDISLFKYLSLFNRKAFRADNAPHQPDYNYNITDITDSVKYVIRRVWLCLAFLRIRNC